MVVREPRSGAERACPNSLCLRRANRTRAGCSDSSSREAEEAVGLGGERVPSVGAL